MMSKEANVFFAIISVCTAILLGIEAASRLVQLHYRTGIVLLVLAIMEWVFFCMFLVNASKAKP